MHKMRDLPNSEKPRERLIKFGSEALSDAELIAIILSSGGKGKNAVIVAQDLLLTFSGLKGLFQAGFEELVQTKNVGIAKATALKASFEIAMRLGRRLDGEASEATTITNPEQVFDLTREKFYGKKQEMIAALTLDARGRSTSVDVVSVGTLSEAIIDPRVIFRYALKKDAASVIIIHNHPSGDPTPSDEDYEVTEKLVEAGKVLGIPVLDHVIVTDSSYVSMKAIGAFGNKLKGGD